MDGQMHSIGKVIRLLFVDPVTYLASFVSYLMEIFHKDMHGSPVNHVYFV